MKNNRGITLIMVLITVMVLGIIMSLIAINAVDTWNKSKIIKFKTNMQIMQKNVDIILEKGINYKTLGYALTEEQIETLDEMITEDTNIITSNTADTGLRYFTEEDIKTVFNIDGLQDEYIINFSIREVISLNGVKKDGVMHYVENGL